MSKKKLPKHKDLPEKETEEIKSTQQIPVPDLSNRKVLLATPAYDGKMNLDYMNSLFQTMQALQAAGARADYAIYANSGSIPRVRNQAVAHMMGHNFTDLVFIDADMGWDALDLCRMLAYDTDIVAAAYPARSQNNPRWIVVWPEEVKRHEPTGLLTARRAGTGFMRIRRSVFEKLEELHPDRHFYAPFVTHEDEIPHLYAFFDYELKEGQDGIRGHLSEDYAFCDLAQEAGFTIWVDPKIKMLHIGTYKWGGVFEEAVEIKDAEEGQEAPRAQ